VTGNLRHLASLLCLALILAALVLPGSGLLPAVLPALVALAALGALAKRIESSRLPVVVRPAAPRAGRGPPTA
jgi:hypothetical protein